ncbi:MAG: response regulator transcription factor [Eubacteriales bacterium]|nr:response regulator transcription factor [Eubacteriales bacterium]
MAEKIRVLVVDDDENINQLVRLYVEKEGYDVISAFDGTEAARRVREEKFDLVILDIMLPGLSGWDVCREIRKKDNTPIIMLTAKGETFDKVLGLELGADDYMVKPFEPQELTARIRAILRRAQPVPEQDSGVLEFDSLQINHTNYTVQYQGQMMELPPKEMELLYFLAARPNKVFTREQLLEQVWGFDYFGDSRTVDVHIKRLREKLALSDDVNWQIKTVWGVGYKFEVR